MDILALIKKQKLTSIKRSISGAENYTQKVKAVATKTARVLQNNSEPSSYLEEYTLRNLYVNELERYTRKTQIAYTGQEFTPKGLALWQRVRNAWEVSGVSMEIFIKAQFTYFHNVFRKIPKPEWLTTKAAIIRAASTVPENVISNNILAEIDTADLFRLAEKQMSDIMHAQNLTREEVYTNLVLPGLVYFPKKYLDADPSWKKINK